MLVSPDCSFDVKYICIVHNLFDEKKERQIYFIYIAECDVIETWVIYIYIYIYIYIEYKLKLWIALKARSNWLLILCYSPPKKSRRICDRNNCNRFLNKLFKSIFFSAILLQCRWLAVDIYLAASRLGKYPPLTTSISVH